jgi:hypothetical protein
MDGRRYSPMLAKATKTLPRGEQWIFEPKLNGYRMLVSPEARTLLLCHAEVMTGQRTSSALFRS